ISDLIPQNPGRHSDRGFPDSQPATAHSGVGLSVPLSRIPIACRPSSVASEAGQADGLAQTEILDRLHASVGMNFKATPLLQ
ncbi:MAG: hypothetical protein PVI92_09635, partial [Chromatiales bacterium]